MDKTSWALFATFLTVVGVVLAFPVNNEPDLQAYEKCIQLHPERYCRIASGFPVEPLDGTKD